MKSVQISEELFFDLARYHLLDQRGEELTLRIRSGLEAKLDKMADRERYRKGIEQGKAHKNTL